MLVYRLRFLRRRSLCDGKHGTTQRSVLHHINLQGVHEDRAGDELPLQRFGTADRRSALAGRMDSTLGTTCESEAIAQICKAVAVRHQHGICRSHHGACRTIHFWSVPGNQRGRKS